MISSALLWVAVLIGKERKCNVRRDVSGTHDIEGFLAEVRSGKQTVRYRKSDIIFAQGDPSSAMFYIESGALKLSIVSAAGKEAVISIKNAGTLIGESCISLDDPVRFHNAIALTETHLVRIDRTAILRILREGGERAIHFISFLIRQNARQQQDLASRLVSSAEENLVRVVASLRHLQHELPEQTIPQISQQTIAEMMGVSRQRVNVLMKRSGITPALGPLRRKRASGL